MSRHTFIINRHHPSVGVVKQNIFLAIGSLDPDKSWKIEIKEVHKERTAKQCRSIFGVAYKTIMQAVGLEGSREKEKLHADFCGEYFGWKRDALDRSIPIRTTTRDENGEDNILSVKEMSDFYAFIQRRVAPYGVHVPDPDPLWNWKDDRP
jgi:hypothetical protein